MDADTLQAGREEVLHHGNRTRVVRVAHGAGTVIRKEALGPGAVQRIRHEVGILRRLADVDGVPRLVDAPDGTGVFTVEDTGGTALAGLVTAASPMQPGALVGLALNLARIVGAVHRRGIVHKDINPSNIVVPGTGDHRPVLIDFGLAGASAEELPGFTHQNQIAGTLAYLAPEQTGRTGRTVDHRADLYALGATLYELATGRPPFDSSDMLRLVHDHLARMPTPPATLNPAVPDLLSQIVMRLLAKEPDHRYQSAEGLVHDLVRVHEALQRGEDAVFPLGERDFALRLAAPSRLIGREVEIDRLGAAYAEALRGGRCVLVAGRAGVGKTALISELRPIVTADGGWFVSGRFDQSRRDMSSDAVVQAMRGLGRLLLAEPEADLAELRPRMLTALGPNAGLLAEMMPEFALLLEVVADVPPPDQEAEPRLFQAGLDVLRAVVSPERPVVIVIDDLQWAPSTAIGFVDALMTGGQLPGLLFVGAHRDDDPSPALVEARARWDHLGATPIALRLENLPAAELSTLVEEMLRLDPREAARLADALGARTDGNPLDTVELINALRLDGVLVPGEEGWTWDEAGVRSYVGEHDVVEIVIARIERLPPATRHLLAVMACLAGEMDLALLRAATGVSEAGLEERLGPALEDGLLVIAHDAGDHATVRFRHERVHQAGYARLEPFQRRELHRTLADTLSSSPAYGSVAAQQYLAVVDEITQLHERRRVAGLFGAAAATVRMTNAVVAETFLASALRLLADQGASDPLVTHLETQLHATLYRLGRLPEADEIYAAIRERSSDPLVLADPTCVQISALTHRGRTAEAMELGLRMLRRLGITVPAPDELDDVVLGGLDDLYRWVEAAIQGDDMIRPEPTDPRLVAAAKVLNRMVSPAYFGDRALMAWLVTEARRLWAEHGPTAALVAPLCHASVATIGLCQDYRTGFGTLRHVLSVSEARGYVPESSQARYLFAVSASHWFEPLEAGVRQAQLAHEALVHAGDLQFAGLTAHATTPALLDSAPTLESYALDVEAGVTFASRSGNEQTLVVSRPYQQLVRAMRGETEAPGSFSDAAFDEQAHLSSVEGNPTALAHFHVARALSAAVFDDLEQLSAHAEAAAGLLPVIESHYHASRAVLLRAMALAQRARTLRRDQSGPLLAELDEWVAWFAQRCIDAPENFQHLLHLLEAERAWALDDFRGAAGHFDAALWEAAPRRRPWQRALIAERAGLFHLENELEYTGRQLLAEARRHYRGWGATGKVRQIERAHPFLHASDTGYEHDGQTMGHTGGVSTEAIDLVGVVRASQALSSVTNVDRLRTRVVEILSEMTGATTVRVLLSDSGRGWFLPPARLGGTAYTVEEAGGAGLLPLTAFRVVERTGESLLVHDATRDDRFARDPYLADVERCSLLVVPVLAKGAPRAMLFLENRLAAGAFSANRLDAVILIAGQLAVSLENAMVYASLEHKVAERTEELAAANERLELLTVTDPLTGLANRRRLSETLRTEWYRAQRTRDPVSAFMVDIDHFKLLNDRYGHLVGDACLKRVAGALVETVRVTDLVARYGGEEFAVILPGAQTENAYAVAERARKAVETLGVENADAPSGVVTVSIGVAAVIPADGATAEELLAAADSALYESKRGGRNQVRIHHH